MIITVNGEQKDLQVETLACVVQHYQLDENLVVTELDGEIVSRENRAQTKLAEGSTIEIVQFVGGG